MAMKTKRGVIPEDAVVDLPSKHHAEGCPEDPERMDWEEITPRTGPHAGVQCARIRCVDCGGETHIPIDELETGDDS